MKTIRHSTTGTLRLPLTPSDGTVWCGPNTDLDILVPYVGCRTDLELVVEFWCDSEYTPGNFEHAPDATEDRGFIEAYLDCEVGRFVLPLSVQRLVFDLVEAEVARARLDEEVQ